MRRPIRRRRHPTGCDGVKADNQVGDRQTRWPGVVPAASAGPTAGSTVQLLGGGGSGRSGTASDVFASPHSAGTAMTAR
ncbi:hypothetical protein [Kibdelosporangium philippinense]|uniref:hypothetical protein n=1 Tax=Kibdelosporangium philippinense TaxID=211113 RepID=UPI00360F7278